ncbi:MAG TPA: M48 family metallopeptidase [Spirochaetia bacterium]|nr:M48 family metallopeptidase [Spirochaetia bacterium]
MTPQTILLVYLLFFFLDLGWDTALTLLNLRHVRRNAGQVPPAFTGIVDAETHARSVHYTLTRGGFGMAAGAVSAAATLAVVLTGFLGYLDSLARQIPAHPYVQGILLMAAVSLLFAVVRLPFSLYSTFGIEARFGFNRTTVRLYAMDMLKGLAISVALGVPLLLLLFWFVDRSGAWWWVWAFGALTAFQLIMSILAPLVIAPLFNKFTPLPDGALKDQIMGLATRLEFRTRGIFVVDSSRRSGHSNAYFTGLGRAKRIVLFDTLVSSHTEHEIVSVLAHEIGHEKRAHIKKGLALSVAMSLVGFWILSLLLHWTPLYPAFGFSQPGSAELLVLLAFCSGPFTFFLQPIFTARSRRQEYEADRFAVQGVGSADGLKSALLRLSRDNLSNLSPHPWYSFFHYSHPTLAERIAALEREDRALREKEPRTFSPA